MASPLSGWSPNVLYGVTMQEQGVSKLLRLDLQQMEEQLGIQE